MRRLLAFLLALAAPATGATAAELDLFDWMGPAPVVLHGEVVHAGRKLVEVRPGEVLRGGLDPRASILVNIGKVNRHVDLDTPRLKLPVGRSYLLLLEPDPRRRRDGPPVYDLVRGARGVREVPLEGAAALIDAARALAEIQDRNDERLTWKRMAELLEATNPMLITTALRHHLKFRRGTLGQLTVIRPLLDHPRPDVREGAARLIAQTLDRHPGQPVPEQDQLHAELAAAARRDPVTEVRVAATEALDDLPGEAIVPLLERIAEEDPEQLVRYTARRLLYERGLRR